jgi:hypothetical protein
MQVAGAGHAGEDLAKKVTPRGADSISGAAGAPEYPTVACVSARAQMAIDVRRIMSRPVPARC